MNTARQPQTTRKRTMNEKINARLGFGYFNPPEELSRDQMKNLIHLLFDHSAHTESQPGAMVGARQRRAQAMRSEEGDRLRTDAV